MADKQHMELFFDRFLEFNLERYKDDPKWLPKFTGLTFSMLTISDITPIMGNTRRNSAVFSAARRFRGLNQSWTPAKAETDLKLYKPVSPDALPSVDKLSEQVEAGVYFYVDGSDIKVGVVIANGIEAGQQAAAVESTLRAALVYDIPTVTVAGVGNSVALVGDTFEGSLVWAIGQEAIEVIPDTDYGQLVAPE